MNEDKQIQKMLKSAKSYFGNDEKIYIYKRTKCGKLDPMPSFVVNEQLGFLKFINKKKSFEMECPYCGKPSFPIYESND